MIRDEWRNELLQQSASSSESESDPEEESKGFVKERRQERHNEGEYGLSIQRVKEGQGVMMFGGMPEKGRVRV